MTVTGRIYGKGLGGGSSSDPEADFDLWFGWDWGHRVNNTIVRLPYFWFRTTVGELGMTDPETVIHFNHLVEIDLTFEVNIIQEVYRYRFTNLTEAKSVPMPSEGISAKIYYDHVEVNGTVKFYGADDPSSPRGVWEISGTYDGDKRELEKSWKLWFDGLVPFPETFVFEGDFFTLRFVDYDPDFTPRTWRRIVFRERIRDFSRHEVYTGYVSSPPSEPHIRLDDLQPTMFVDRYFPEPNTYVDKRNYIWWVAEFREKSRDTYDRYDVRPCYDPRVFVDFRSLLYPHQTTVVTNDFGISAVVTHDMRVWGEGQGFYRLWFTTPTLGYWTRSPVQLNDTYPPTKFPLTTNPIGVSRNQVDLLCLSHKREVEEG